MHLKPVILINFSNKSHDFYDHFSAMSIVKYQQHYLYYLRAIIATKRMQNFFKTLPAKMKEEEERGVVKSASADSGK